MPPYKKPLTLQKLSLKAIAVLINSACDILHNVHGKYDPLLCKSDITDIQNHLLSYIPRDFIDEVCNEWINMDIDYDPRLCIAVYMHRHTKEFNFGQIHEALSSYCDDTSFWRSLLCQTDCIVSINLSYFCTDEILDTVGKNCYNLEYINILSPSASRRPISFPDITDKGLEHLEKCKALKTVEMDKDIVVKSSMKVSIEGIRHLLKNLPVVENISFGQMGTVIADNMQDVNSLSLTHIIETDPKLDHILAILRLCPNLRDLTLFSCFEDTLNAIKNSTLNILAFHLHTRCFNSSLLDFLFVKGMHLTTLDLHGAIIIEHLVKAVGMYCPNIVCLTLNQYADWEDYPDLLSVSNEKMFLKLESLKVYRGSRHISCIHTNLQVRRILQIILKHANKIKILELYVLNDDSFDDVFSIILESNPLTELTELYARCNLSMEKVLYFFRRPNIRKLTVKKSDSVTHEDIRMLMNEISQNNLDILLHILCDFG